MRPLRDHQGAVALSTRNVHFDHNDTPDETSFRLSPDKSGDWKEKRVVRKKNVWW